MSVELWTVVDDYIARTLIGPDADLDHAVRESDAAGLPQISVTPNQGKLLYLLARLAKAKNILEIGTLGGYSSIWLARALPAGGKLITLEADPKHAQVARSNIAHAGLEDRVEVRLGLALEILPTLAASRTTPFDFIFIDADKPNIPAYFDWAVKLSRKESVIVVDNVVRDGAIIEEKSADPGVVGVRRLNNLLSDDRRVSATTIQTVGGKGYDGFTIALVSG
jgi:predicted O-methyltransferase YrrM